MIEYIKQIAQSIINLNEAPNSMVASIRGGAVPDGKGMIIVLREELDRLDPRDFEPAARHDFVMNRATIRSWTAPGHGINIFSAQKDVKAALGILQSYRGEGSGAVVRKFPSVTNPDVKKIVERDYTELTQKAFPDQSWKSTVILAGSILEAVLLDRLRRDAATISAATTSIKAPTKRAGITRDITINSGRDEWSLFNLIEVACDLSYLPFADVKAIHVALRDYRNLVHPHLELKMGIQISEGHATAAKGMLDVCLDQLK